MGSNGQDDEEMGATRWRGSNGAHDDVKKCNLVQYVGECLCIESSMCASCPTSPVV